MTEQSQSEEHAPTAVYSRQGDAWLPSVLSRGPWDPRAQHGGAPCGLLAHVAEQAMGEPGWQLGRLTVELIRPVPVSLLRTEAVKQASRATARISIDLFDGGTLVARAHALMLRQQAMQLPADVPGWTPERLLPLPADCSEKLRIPGLPDGVSFYGSAVQTRLAQGDPSQPGGGASWFRLVVPFIEGMPTSPAMRAISAADFGNGLSWVLPARRYVFANADLSLHLHRQPVGEWIGLQSQTQADASGAGVTLSRLFDEQGSIGVAAQTLVLRERS
ncbi:MAG: thioesterase family protein [Proteobacteria bacterium]|nr:thioesterase family protein [Pseudomonadota bacterium]